MRRIAAGTLALAIWASTAGSAAAAADPSCKVANPEVIVETPDASVDVQDVRSVVDYTNFPWQTQNTMAPGWVINGLTVAQPRSGFRIEGWASPGCYGIARVTVTLSYADPVKVYIADKYPPGSCPHTIILEHEMHHVDIFRRGRVIYAARIREVIGVAAKEATGANSQEDAQGIVSDALDRVIREFTAALGAAHGAIDTVENYRKTQARCPSW